MPVPKYDDLFNPLLQAMHKLGGSALTSEQEDTVAALLNLTEKDVAEIHRGNRTKLTYRLAWARTYLKRYGLLENKDYLSRQGLLQGMLGLKHKEMVPHQ
jgi:restriction system protein